MATQQIDGSWSPTEPFEDAFATFTDALEKGTARRFVVADTVTKVEEEKKRISLEDELAQLRKEVAELKARDHQGLVHVPTPQETKEFSRGPRDE